MALTTSRTRSATRTSDREAVHARPVRTAKSVVRTQAGLQDSVDYVSKAFLNIFSPAKTSMGTWTGTDSTFPGKIPHTSRRPFSDGFSFTNDPAPKKPGPNPETTPTTTTGSNTNSSETAEDSSDLPPVTGIMRMIQYLNQAMERVVGHNFKGEDTEPDWTGSGSSGWKGDIHSSRHGRDKDGFHTRK